MNAAFHERATEIFGLACRRPAEERDAFIREMCGDDAALRAYVERLIAHDEPETDGFLEPAAGVVQAAMLEHDMPEEVGTYRLLEPIGQGGMGVVYRARQHNPERDVALKLLRVEHATDDLLARFRREGALLARLQHPGIAQIYEADSARVGATGRRQPFLAMEFVQGCPITEYVGRASLSVEARLRLLAQVCDAVHHAHQRGVIHRDLKPANILVDEEGRPRILDFGIAKARDGDHDLTLHDDDSRTLLGTLTSMSPEQLDGAEDVDVRSDVFALGVIGFELLTGTVPRDVRGLPVARALSMLRDMEPTPLRRAQPELSRDLEAIIGRATAIDREQRYDSASAFRADLLRYLNGEPVEARAPTLLYTLGKLARRNTVAFVSAGVVCLTVIAALIITISALFRADAARIAAEEETANQEAMASFLEAVVFASDPDLQGADLSFLDAIEISAARINDTLVDRPAVEAEARELVGFVLRRHGRYESAVDHLRQAYRIRREMLGEDHPITANTARSLASLYQTHGGNAELAIEMIEHTRDIEVAHGVSPDAHAWTVLSLAYGYLDAGRATDALAAARESAALLERGHAGETGTVFAARALRVEAEALLHLDRAEEALAVADEGLRRATASSGQTYGAARLHLTRGRIMLWLNRVDEARDDLDASAALFAELVEEDHPERVEVVMEQAAVALAAGDIERARTLSVDASTRFQRRLVRGHWLVAMADAITEMCDIATTGEDSGLVTEPLQRKLGIAHWRVMWMLEQQVRLAEARGDIGRVDLYQTWLVRLRARRAQSAN